MKGLSRLDVFPKFDTRFEQDARQRTALGGVLSMASILIITFLVVGEIRYFLSTVEQHEMYVDPHIGGIMHMKVNITFPRVPCDLMTADAIDAFGEYVENVVTDTAKVRVDSSTLKPLGKARQLVDLKKQPTNGNETGNENCPTCYGAEKNPGECCHTCDDVRRAFAERQWEFHEDDVSIAQCAHERLKVAADSASAEGCNLHASFSVPRVTGNIHFVPGRMFNFFGQHLHSFKGETIRKLNLSHIVHALEFGERFPGQNNPMDGMVNARGVKDPSEPLIGRFTYFVKVVPTLYQVVSMANTGNLVESNQYSVTHHFTPSWAAPKEGETDNPNSDPLVVPGVFISYDISPIRVSVTRTHPYPSIVHLVLQLCAVGGGVYTVTGLIDSLFFHGIKRVQEKINRGKQF
ncbi:Endoplasmic Reticulum-Golgi Intermediate Compartment (ERGIC)/Endoplasmic reticulum vesicle transporter, putative [Trypanosoma equiperdum]|uniref:Uncharacterized protein n=4 Tax=Trypanozoon TaxID=39700 RepID=Q57YS9_TRYB2|nr:hypothetical protein, conserved [Trypanosoma brucei gambiense DAL972]XP_847556.1 hypothetical protein, conserved [Trypanosoma brucei brucei TREU927]AAX69235.1 hypothetical protein, conserved [Trypanosoma brucei]RHW73347.1 Endoplasmic Reticulum-Golgi Intermediate Compartment (ERGIC) [Trypanosoma brucei equiperdum]SCU65244.1 Endoplasmic Reticulum-Golgi Intermediate Compartment (ERGIC)/Endoplasmic reticulum vesicle transporter, putative [Trypanosoma equiperdum]AAZ13490.1 hypothetical protein, |eukprot:XP_011776090.1 hypothetical protein, conserved [Trypanosoma brucei gambiense DAL972]